MAAASSTAADAAAKVEALWAPASATTSSLRLALSNVEVALTLLRERGRYFVAAEECAGLLRAAPPEDEDGRDAYTTALTRCVEARAFLAERTSSFAGAKDELRRVDAVLAAALDGVRAALAARADRFGDAALLRDGRWRAAAAADDEDPRAAWLWGACAVVAGADDDGDDARGSDDDDAPDHLEPLRTATTGGSSPRRRRSGDGPRVALARAYGTARRARGEGAVRAYLDAAPPPRHDVPYGLGSHGLLRTYAFCRAALAGERSAARAVARGALGAAAPREALAAAAAAPYLDLLKRSSRRALAAVASAPGARGDDGSVAARREAARCALDLLLRHRASAERPLRKACKQLDRSLLPRLDELAADLTQGAVDALRAALDAVAGDGSADGDALALAGAAAACVRRLLAPPTRAAFSLLRLAPGGAPPPWARDAPGRRAALSASMVAAADARDALLCLRAVSSDFGYAALKGADARRAAAAAESPRRPTLRGAAKAVIATTVLKRLSSMRSRSNADLDAADAPPPAPPRSAPPADDACDPRHRDAVDFGRTLVGELLRSLARRAEAMRGERGDDGADRDEADSPAHRLRARIAGEEDRASSAAAARLARARADFYVLLNARFLARELGAPWDEAKPAGARRRRDSTAALLDGGPAAGAAPPPGDDKLVSDELFDWLRALGGAAKAAYLDAWRGAAAAADDGGPGGDDLDADASSKRLKKRFAHFNGHFETLATATAKWACDDAALRDELKADLKRLVADPWEAFYARNAHRPFSSKHQDKYTRWAPSLVDAALDRCFDPGRAVAPRRPSTHWAGAAAQAALPP